jgi:hypothetical protein
VSSPTVSGSAQGKYALTDNRGMTMAFNADQRYLGLWWSAGYSVKIITSYEVGGSAYFSINSLETRENTREIISALKELADKFWDKLIL